MVDISFYQVILYIGIMSALSHKNGKDQKFDKVSQLILISTFQSQQEKLDKFKCSIYADRLVATGDALVCITTGRIVVRSQMSIT